MRNIFPSTSRFYFKGSRSHITFAVLIVGSLLAFPFFIGSAGSSITPITIENKTTSSLPADSHSSIAAPNFDFLTAFPQAGPVTLQTFAGDCSTPKSVYNVRDTDLKVCAKFTNAVPGWRLIWSNANFVAVQNTPVTTANGSGTFTLNANSSLGDWRVILYEPFGGSVQAVTRFTVVDAQNPEADVAISKGLISSNASSGQQVLYSIEVTNHGPSDAASVQLTDDVPANTKFHSFGQLSGPSFTCTNPNEGETGTTTCTISSLAYGETAVFVATY